MKKIFAAFLVFALILTGCSGKMSDSSKPIESLNHAPADSSEVSVSDTASAAAEEKGSLPGSYTLPEGWVKAEKYSTSDKIFYVEEGHENDEAPDNISINVGTNRYSADEHETFRDAIVQQLLRQLQGIDADLGGDGTHTEQGYIVYIFTIKESDVVTKQYYIVDDYRYCLIHLTNFTKSESAYDAAQTIADSFVWENAEND